MSLISMMLFNKIKTALKKHNVLLVEVFFIDLEKSIMSIDNKEQVFEVHKIEINETIKQLKITDIKQILITKQKTVILYNNNVKNTL